MQQIIKARHAAAFAALMLGVVGSTQAASELFTVSVTTVDDVTLSEEQTLSFGTNVYIDANGVCTMDAGTPDEADVQMDQGGQTASGFGDLTGGGCVNDTGTPGLYKIAGLSATDVTITIGGIAAGGDFAFAPAGCIPTYDGSATNGDSCDAYTAGTASAGITTPLAGAADGVNTADGELVFTVGGTITVGAADLTANLAYTDTFPVDVVY